MTMKRILGLSVLALALPIGSIAQVPAGGTPAPPAAAPSGEAVYVNNCAACHQPTGAGIGPFPALANNAMVGGPADVLAITVLVGRGGMPAFKSEINDADMAAMLTYMRGAWGNKAGPVTTAEVAAYRTKSSAEAEAKDLTAH